MQYLYHHVPTNMQSSILYPLNTLQTVLPEVYQYQSAKYQNRAHVLEQRIPLFNNCLWNDVIFCIALHPQKLVDARRHAGWPDAPPQQYFKIDPRKLDQSKLGVYLFEPKHQHTTLQAGDFAAYQYEDLKKYEIIPPETNAYFRSEREGGQPRIRLFYRYIPHVLYYGAIDTTDLEVITVS